MIAIAFEKVLVTRREGMSQLLNTEGIGIAIGKIDDMTLTPEVDNLGQDPFLIISISRNAGRNRC